ncbi:sulfur carrier protein ThiS [Pleionea sediminis]|uniref:sulfur carrier protein ThiS n=1 Tax=Pleionea sediminis TaxID=2569479 RepID=UPI001186F305|nr:sulfur carrier protein ThiS [Pleionea sediminis]
MIDITINGTAITTEHRQLCEFLDSYFMKSCLQSHKKESSPNENISDGNSEFKFAIAINDNFVPRSQYQTITLKNNDRIELLSPMQGG